MPCLGAEPMFSESHGGTCLCCRLLLPPDGWTRLRGLCRPLGALSAQCQADVTVGAILLVWSSPNWRALELVITPPPPTHGVSLAWLLPHRSFILGKGLLWSPRGAEAKKRPCRVYFSEPQRAEHSLDFNVPKVDHRQPGCAWYGPLNGKQQ